MPVNQPLVSVIIPFFNGGLWLKEAVYSVLGQSYSNWEIVLIDDGSEEKDTHIARQLVLRSPERIIYTEHAAHKNIGLTASRNAGIRISHGSLLAFLDADDCWLPDKLSSQVSLFQSYPEAAMVCESSIFWYSWNDPAAEDMLVPIGVKNGAIFPAPGLQEQLYPLGEGAPPCPSGIMIKRAAFDRTGGFEESFCGELQLYEDQAFLSKIYLNEWVYISGSCNNKYRKRSDSMSSAASDKSVYKRVRLYYLSWLEKYMKDRSLSNPLLRELIFKARVALAEPDYPGISL